jgi:CTP synthase
MALFCNVPLEAVIEEKDKDFSIYEVPLSLVDHGLDSLIVKKLGLGLKAGLPELDNWRHILHALRNPQHEISIAVVGKYAEHKDAYKSIYEAIDHAGIHHQAQVRVGRIQSEEIEREGPARLLAGYDGILVPGGFGERGIEGKIEAIQFAREKGIPFFGICLGMQCAAIEFARNVAGLTGAHSTEYNKDTPHPVICLLDEQRNITDKGGTMRLGAQPAVLADGSQAREAYGRERISERHRHRYEFNNQYRQQFAAHGFAISGTSPDGKLVEIIEFPGHPWFVAVQYHPEFKSKPTAAHPLFAGFVGAAIERHSHRGERLAEVEA